MTYDTVNQYNGFSGVKGELEHSRTNQAIIGDVSVKPHVTTNLVSICFTSHNS